MDLDPAVTTYQDEGVPSVDEPVQALRRLLRTDPGFADEPRRLARGLLDLLPYDDRAVRLLALGAELGVPALIGDGQLADARRALMDRAGLHPDAAGWVVEAWRAVGAGERVSDFGAVRLAAWPDGTLLVVTRESRGVFGATVDGSGPSHWRLLAPAAGAGGLAVSAVTERIVVAWPQTQGVYALEVHNRDGTLAGDPPEPVTEVRAGLTPDTPFAILAVDESLNHLVWPVDGGRLRRGTWRAWPSDDPDEDLPPVGATVTALDAGRVSPDAALLVVATDHGRVLATRWDLLGEHVTSWREVALPGAAVTVAAAGRLLFAETADGEIVDGGGAVVAPASGERLVAAAAAGDTAWLASVTADTMTLSRPGSGAAWSLRAP
jgi:hypothetical protein